MQNHSGTAQLPIGRAGSERPRRFLRARSKRTACSGGTSASAVQPGPGITQGGVI